MDLLRLLMIFLLRYSNIYAAEVFQEVALLMEAKYGKATMDGSVITTDDERTHDQSTATWHDAESGGWIHLLSRTVEQLDKVTLTFESKTLAEWRFKQYQATHEAAQRDM